jgi:integrase
VSPAGDVIDYAHWRQRIWLPAVKATRVEGFTFHDLRRANATVLVAEGVDVKTAQVRLGHADPRTTLGIYARATSEGDRKAADAVAKRLMVPTPTPADTPKADVP